MRFSKLNCLTGASYTRRREDKKKHSRNETDISFSASKLLENPSRQLKNKTVELH